MLKIYIKLLPLQGVTNERALTQGVASLALGYVLLPFQGVHYGLHKIMHGLYATRANPTCTEPPLKLKEVVG